MKRSSILSLIVMCLLSAFSQERMSLSECRQLALANNKQLMIARQRVSTAGYQQKQAFAAYLPAIDFQGGYLYNQKELSIFDSDQLLPTKTFNLQTQSYEFNLVKNPLTGEPIKDPATGHYVPETVALIPKEEMQYDIRNVFFGSITLTQPVYMGGKIVALNEIAKIAKQAAEEMEAQEEQNVIYAVDAAYWQVVSLKSKHKLATSYVSLLDSLDRNVALMVEQGVATRSDKLSVDVKLNSAQVDLVKVENGLALSRMALAQVCGLPIDKPIMLEDEDKELSASDCIKEWDRPFDMQEIYDTRPDIRALRLSVKAAEGQKKLARSAMLPNLALIGAYSFSNPNMFDGFKKKFSGAFSVGAMLTVPLWHWGGDYSKYKAAESDKIIKSLQLQDAEQLVGLQVNQASYRAEESIKTYRMTNANMEKANENLRSATLAFREGMATADNVMEAQTAWLKANSERIDAMIDVCLCKTYLLKSLGILGTR